jgi:hypothetical protein
MEVAMKTSVKLPVHLSRPVVILALLVLVSFTLACSVLGSSATPTPANVLLEDNFTDNTTGWESGQYNEGEVGYKDGAYYVVSTTANSAMWGVSPNTYSDTVVDIDTEQVSAPSNNNNDFGVMCRVQDNGDGYALLISGDGFYGIQLASNGSFTNLVDWTESSTINKGNATNHIRAICNGDTFTLYVNDKKLAEASDSTFSSGKIALSATTYEADSTEIHFDNLVISEP